MSFDNISNNRNDVKKRFGSLYIREHLNIYPLAWREYNIQPFLDTFVRMGFIESGMVNNIGNDESIEILGLDRIYISSDIVSGYSYLLSTTKQGYNILRQYIHKKDSDLTVWDDYRKKGFVFIGVKPNIDLFAQEGNIYKIKISYSSDKAMYNSFIEYEEETIDGSLGMFVGNMYNYPINFESGDIGLMVTDKKYDIIDFTPTSDRFAIITDELE